MMKRCCLWMVLCLLFSTPGYGEEGFGKARYHILLITSEQGEPYQSSIDCMSTELAAMGYRQGQNLTIKSYSLDHYKGRAKNILKREEKVSYDLIAVFGTIGTIALKELILDDPAYPKIVFSAVTDPVGVGVIDDFSTPPKHNFTGVAYSVPVKERLNFIKQVMPAARKIGLIYADMPQSHSYNRWLRDLLKSDPAFGDYEILFRSVEFVVSKGGIIRMAKNAAHHIRELDPKVDVFMSANDQLAIQPFFPQTAYELSTKPLVGVGIKDVMERRGATMAIFTSPEENGRQTATMIRRLLNGAAVREVIPEKADAVGVAFDMEKIKRFGIVVPDALLKQAGSNITGN